jgi:hypothetical protein
MATEKFVVRVLDAAGQLLAWAEVWARPEPQRAGASCPFWPTALTQFLIEQRGEASRLTIHWCDLDIAREKPIDPPVHVEAGQRFDFTWMEPVWLVPGMRDVPLPAVTERRPVSVSPPTGNLSAVGQLG